MTVYQETETTESITLFTKLKIFLKKNWLLVLLLCLVIWWFYFKDGNTLDMLKGKLSPSKTVDLGLSSYKLSGQRGLTTTPTGLREFLY
jgi:hypothetical protein